MNAFKVLFQVAFLASAFQAGWSLGCGDETNTIKLQGKCPEITYITNVNVDRTVGRFYVQWGNNVAECAGGCTIDNTLTVSENLYDSQVCCSDGCLSTCGAEYGSETYSQDLDNPGVFNSWTSGDQFYILDYTDNWSIYYRCSDVDPCTPRVEDVFIESRSRDVSDEETADIVEALGRNGIDPVEVNVRRIYQECDPATC